MLKVEHIGIAVKNVKNANLLFEKLFGQGAYKKENVDSEKVTTSFFMALVKQRSNGVLEASRSWKNGAISKFIEKRGEGIHHIAFASEGYLC